MKPAAATADTRSVATRSAEAATAALVGAALGATAGAVIRVAAPVASVAGLNGLIAGWRGTYRWNSADGVTAFVLDSTWTTTMTAAGIASQLIGVVRGRPGYVHELSQRQNRHVYRRGFQPRQGFAVTLGNVISGAGDVSRARRAKLITDHENVHIWQARWFGPAYPVLYIGWMIGGAVAGGAVWLASKRDESFRRVVESYAYYLNPMERWAYSRDAHWPPTGMVASLGTVKPVARPFATTPSAPS